MIAAIVAAFILGIRHAADPDHLAAIDNLTRNIAASSPAKAKFAGTLFAAGHSLMVLAIAGAIALGGKYAGGLGSVLETAGGWLSVAILVAIAAWNVRRLRNGNLSGQGLRSRFLPKCLRNNGNVFAAVPTGFLFGLGFETPSQIAAYIAILYGGLSGMAAVGFAFCIGMLLTDTCDSLFVNRLVRGPRSQQLQRNWTWILTFIAFFVAAFESTRLAGIYIPLQELQISMLIMIVLVAAYVALRRPNAVSSLEARTPRRHRFLDR